jgi:hypothetical protein
MNPGTQTWLQALGEMLGNKVRQAVDAVGGPAPDYAQQLTGNNNPAVAQSVAEHEQGKVYVPGTTEGWVPAFQRFNAERQALIEQNNPIRDVPVAGGASTMVADILTDPLTWIMAPGVGAGVKFAGAKLAPIAAKLAVPKIVQQGAKVAAENAVWGGIAGAEKPGATPQDIAVGAAEGAALGVGMAGAGKAISPYAAPYVSKIAAAWKASPLGKPSTTALAHQTVDQFSTELNQARAVLQSAGTDITPQEFYRLLASRSPEDMAIKQQYAAQINKVWHLYSETAKQNPKAFQVWDRLGQSPETAGQAGVGAPTGPFGKIYIPGGTAGLNQANLTGPQATAVQEFLERTTKEVYPESLVTPQRTLVRDGHYWLTPEGTVRDIQWFNQRTSHGAQADQIAKATGLPGGDAAVAEAGLVRMQTGADLAVQIQAPLTDAQKRTIQTVWQNADRPQIYYELGVEAGGLPGTSAQQGMVTRPADLWRVAEEHLPIPGGPSRVVNETLAKPVGRQGGTFDPKTLNEYSGSGYGVGGVEPGTEMYVEQFTPQSVQSFMREHEATLSQPGMHVGTWVEDGKVYLDISQVVPDMDDALKLAAQRGEKAIYSFASGDSIYVVPDTFTKAFEQPVQAGVSADIAGRFTAPPPPLNSSAGQVYSKILLDRMNNADGLSHLTAADLATTSPFAPKNSPVGLDDLRQMLEAGRPFLAWYHDISNKLAGRFAPERLSELSSAFGATSPRALVTNNVLGMLRAVEVYSRLERVGELPVFDITTKEGKHAWQAWRKINLADGAAFMERLDQEFRGTGMLRDKLRTLADIYVTGYHPGAGIKAPSFGQNFKLSVLGLPDDFVTNDGFMAVLFGFTPDELGTGGQFGRAMEGKYGWISGVIQALADEHGLQPKEVQAALWTVVRGFRGPKMQLPSQAWKDWQAGNITLQNALSQSAVKTALSKSNDVGAVLATPKLQQQLTAAVKADLGRSPGMSARPNSYTYEDNPTGLLKAAIPGVEPIRVTDDAAAARAALRNESATLVAASVDEAVLASLGHDPVTNKLAALGRTIHTARLDGDNLSVAFPHGNVLVGRRASALLEHAGASNTAVWMPGAQVPTYHAAALSTSTVPQEQLQRLVQAASDSGQIVARSADGSRLYFPFTSGDEAEVYNLARIFREVGVDPNLTTGAVGAFDDAAATQTANHARYLEEGRLWHGFDTTLGRGDSGSQTAAQAAAAPRPDLAGLTGTAPFDAYGVEKGFIPPKAKNPVDLAREAAQAPASAQPERLIAGAQAAPTPLEQIGARKLSPEQAAQTFPLDDEDPRALAGLLAQITGVDVKKLLQAAGKFSNAEAMTRTDMRKAQDALTRLGQTDLAFLEDRKLVQQLSISHARDVHLLQLQQRKYGPEYLTPAWNEANGVADRLTQQIRKNLISTGQMPTLERWSQNKVFRALTFLNPVFKPLALLSPRFHVYNVTDMTIKGMAETGRPMTSASAATQAALLWEMVPDTAAAKAAGRMRSTSFYWTGGAKLLGQPEGITEGYGRSQGRTWVDRFGEGNTFLISGFSKLPKWSRQLVMAEEDAARTSAFMQGKQRYIQNGPLEEFAQTVQEVYGAKAADEVRATQGFLGPKGLAEILSNYPEVVQPWRLGGNLRPTKSSLAKDWMSVLRKGDEAGVQLSNKYLFNYREQTAADTLLSQLLLFHVFSTRNLVYYPRLFAEHPGFGMAVLAYENASEQRRRERGYTTKALGMVPAGGPGQGMAEILLGPNAELLTDPVSYISIVQQLKPFIKNMSQTGDQQTVPGQILEGIQNAGFSPLPTLAVPLAVINKLSGGAVLGADQPVPGFIPQASTISSAASAISGAAGGGPIDVGYMAGGQLLGQPNFDEIAVRHRIAEMAVEVGTPGAYDKFMDDPSSDIYRQAASQVAKVKGVRGAASWTAGLPVQVIGKGEQDIRGAQAANGWPTFDPNAPPGEYSAQRRTAVQQEMSKALDSNSPQLLQSALAQQNFYSWLGKQGMDIQSFMALSPEAQQTLLRAFFSNIFEANPPTLPSQGYGGTTSSADKLKSQQESQAQQQQALLAYQAASPAVRQQMLQDPRLAPVLVRARTQHAPVWNPR